MSDLHERALKYLSLRDAAPAAPWRCHGQDHSICVIGGKGQFSLFRIDSGGRAAMEFAAKAHDMADLIRDQEKKIAALLAENERLAGFVSKLHARPVGPDRCPFTGREFWGNITHPELGEVATYGGPFDTYTLPARTDDDEEYFVRRFDHDRGHWLLDDMEFIGLKLVDDQLYTSEDDPAELRARAEAAEARYKALCEAEPVAEFRKGKSGNFVNWFINEWTLPNKTLLIPRPSMEVGK